MRFLLSMLLTAMVLISTEMAAAKGRGADDGYHGSRGGHHGESSSGGYSTGSLDSEYGSRGGRAAAIAAEVFPGIPITKVEREDEHGKQFFSVRFANGGRVDVDADGAVVRVSQP